MRIPMGLRQVLLVVLFISSTMTTSISAQEDDLVYILAVAWSHDGSQIAAVGVRPENTQGYIRVIDVQTMQSVYQEDPLPGGFTSVSWSPDDRFIAVGSYDTTVWIFDLEQETHAATLSGHGSTVTSVDWSSDGTRLVSGGSWDQLVFLWDMTTYQPIRSLEMTAFINNVAFSPDDRTIAVGNEIGFSVFPATLDPGDSRAQRAYRYIEGRSGAIAWSSDGRLIAFGNQTIRHLSGDRPNAHLFIIDANNRTLIRDIESPWGSIAGPAWSPDDHLLAVYHQDDLVTVLDGETGSVLETFTGGGPSRYSIGNLDFSPYGGRLAYGVTIDPLQLSRTLNLENAGTAIVVPAPSLERLQAIADACNAPATVEQLLPTSDAAGQLSAFVSSVEALPENTIPPACAADLIAVAEALRSQ